MAIATETVEVLPDTSKFNRQLTDELTKSANVAGKSAGASLAQSLRRGLVAAGGVALLKGVLQETVDLAEQGNKVGVVFGESADQVRDFARSSAQALGQSQRQALAAAGTFGNLFTSLRLSSTQSATMSVELTKLASDLASFNNSPVDEALLALRAGLVGETEPLRKFGVNLNDASLKEEAVRQGLVKLGVQVLPAAARAQAAYALILQQSTNAQGDFARTSDGAANQQRILQAEVANLKAEIGEGLLPILKESLGVLRGVTGFLSDNQTFTQTAVQIGLITAAGVALNRGINSTPRLLGNLNAGLRGTGVDAATGGAKIAALGGALVSAATAGVVLGEVSAQLIRSGALSFLGADSDQTIERLDRAGDATLSLADAQRALNQSVQGRAFLKSLAVDIRDAASGGDAFGDVLGKLRGELDRLGGSAVNAGTGISQVAADIVDAANKSFSTFDIFAELTKPKKVSAAQAKKLLEANLGNQQALATAASQLIKQHVNQPVLAALNELVGGSGQGLQTLADQLAKNPKLVGQLNSLQQQTKSAFLLAQSEIASGQNILAEEGGRVVEQSINTLLVALTNAYQSTALGASAAGSDIIDQLARGLSSPAAVEAAVQQRRAILAALQGDTINPPSGAPGNSGVGQLLDPTKPPSSGRPTDVGGLLDPTRSGLVVEMDGHKVGTVIDTWSGQQANAYYRGGV